jgi:hypothetical protein
MRQAGLKHQSTTAEIKSTASDILPSKFMPQLWFGRTPLLLYGTHSNGTFYKVSIADPGALLALGRNYTRANCRGWLWY